MALDKDDQVIGYKFVHLGKMMEAIRGGMDPREAYEKNIGTYGRYDDAVKSTSTRGSNKEVSTWYSLKVTKEE